MSSKNRIMDAAYQILIEDGYSGLTTRKISEEAGVDKALIYHHYGSKKGLIKKLIHKIGVEVEKEHEKIVRAPQNEMLEQLLSLSFSMEEEGRWEFEKALLEIQAQASKDKELSEKLEELDEKFLEILENIFNKLGASEPQNTAEIYLSLVHGVLGRKTSLRDQEGLVKNREQVKKVINQIIND